MKLGALSAFVIAADVAPAFAEASELSEPSDDASTESSTLVSVGIAGGHIPGTSGDMTLRSVGGEVGFDRSLTRHLWARAQVGFGLPSWEGDGGWNMDVETNDQGLLLQARAGVTARACTGHLCVFGGVDGGVTHVTYDGRRTVRYAPNPDNGGGGFVDLHALTVDRTDLVVVPRAGLEIGGSLKFRPTLELPTTPEGSAIQVQLALVAEL